MISYIFLGIVMLSEWKHWSLNEPCNLAQMTLEKLYNKSYEKFMLSKWPKNASIDKKDNLSFIMMLLLLDLNCVLQYLHGSGT